MTEFTTRGRKQASAVLTAESVTNGTAINAITVNAPNAKAVIGVASAVAATTFTLQGSVDGTTWVQDTAGVSITAATGFRFTNRWVYYRVVADKDAAGTTTVDVTLAALLT